MTQEAFNLIVAIGIIATFVISLIGIIVSVAREKNTTYKTIITAERTKNNNIAKEYLAEVLELISNPANDFENDSYEKFTQLEEAKIAKKQIPYMAAVEKAAMLTRLHLNHDNDYNKEMNHILEMIQLLLANYCYLYFDILRFNAKQEAPSTKDGEEIEKKKEEILNKLPNSIESLKECAGFYFKEEQKIIENLAKKGKSK